MHQGDPPDLGPARSRLCDDLVEFRNHHLVVRLVVEEPHVGAPLGVVAHRAAEQHDRTTIRPNAPFVDRVDREPCVCQAKPVVAIGRGLHSRIVAVRWWARRPLVLRLHYDLGSVERGPVPPHERTWRHPSELAAEQRSALRAQSAAPSTRVFALTTGTLGLLAVGVLILTVTPRRLDAPIAISASTTPATAPAVGANPERVRRRPARRIGARLRRPRRGHHRPGLDPAGAGDTDRRRSPGDHHRGRRRRRLRRSDRGAAGFGASQVPGEVIEKSGDTWLIALDEAETGHEIAGQRPTSSEMVTVMNSPPVTIELAELGDPRHR